MEKLDIKILVDRLNNACDAYYNTGMPILNDAEYDELLEQLKKVEKETGIVLSNSPTQHAGTVTVSEINKVKHEIPMLSLDKCHSIKEIEDFIGKDDYYISVKCDGLSTRLIYENGELISAATRGNGELGQDVTFHAKQFKNIPLSISYKNRLVVDGESVILYNDFEDINAKMLEEGLEPYKNPRNLASGTLGSQDSKLTKDRKLTFIAWRVIEGIDSNSMSYKLSELSKYGFSVVPVIVNSNDVESSLDEIRKVAKELYIPLDGAVIAKDDINLANSMGRTEKFFRHSIAYKYEDENAITTFRDIRWTVGRTGQITPTALFDDVEIDGTTVNKASVHNLTILKDLGLRKNCTAYVYKANMIIPQIDYCENDGTEDIEIPTVCPCCSQPVVIRHDGIADVMYCENPTCSAKILSKFSHFVSKPCMNIDGLSEATLEKFINEGFIKTYKDIYHLSDYRDKIVNMEGFGKKSYDNLIKAIETSRNVKFENYLASLGISLIGKTASKTIARALTNPSHESFMKLFEDKFDFTTLEDFGESMNGSLWDWYNIGDELTIGLAEELNFIQEENNMVENDFISGKVFVVTGAFVSMKRTDLEKIITDRGGKLSGSVSKKTDFLLTNDGDSGSTKANKAKELGIPIMSEAEFLSKI